MTGVQTCALPISSEADLAMVRGALDGTAPLEGLVVDQDQRWALLTSLVAAGAADTAEVEAERERDNTSLGREKAARALASAPTSEAKEAAWKGAVEQGDLPNAVINAMAAGFGRARDPEVLRPFLPRYVTAIEDVWGSRTHAIAVGVGGEVERASCRERVCQYV